MPGGQQGVAADVSARRARRAPPAPGRGRRASTPRGPARDCAAAQADSGIGTLTPVRRPCGCSAAWASSRGVQRDPIPHDAARLDELPAGLQIVRVGANRRRRTARADRRRLPGRVGHTAVPPAGAHLNLRVAARCRRSRGLPAMRRRPTRDAPRGLRSRRRVGSPPRLPHDNRRCHPRPPSTSAARRTSRAAAGRPVPPDRRLQLSRDRRNDPRANLHQRYLGWLMSPACRQAVVSIDDMSSTRINAVNRFERVSGSAMVDASRSWCSSVARACWAVAETPTRRANRLRS